MSFEQILDFIRFQNEFFIYGVLLVSAFIENLFPPFPGDSVTLAGAFLAGEGNIGYFGVLISTTSGGLLGMMVLYYFGRSKGRKFFEKRNSKYFGRTALERVEKLFRRYGSSILVVSRFLAGVRSAIAIAAGIGDVKALRMTGLSLISFLLWNAILLGLMIATKSNWEMIMDIVRKYTYLLLILGIAAVLAIVVSKIWRKRKS
jgi:membrane protein DedA with SNARE-associated domain